MAALPVACLDVGSTFTKGVCVDAATGELLAGASVPTTVPVAGRGDVMDGVDDVLAQLRRAAGPADRVLACSSAGGGLRLAVVGYEREVTGEAGRRVGLTAGGHVVHVHAGPLDRCGEQALAEARPDVVLLVGGTDGGNADVLVHNASRLAALRLRAPVVLAGNAAATDDAAAALARTRRRVVMTANLLPRIGVLAPEAARIAVRDVFLRHVIGGKGLSRRGFTRLVRGATPDLVLAGVEALADGAGPVAGAGDVLVVDVGGATTDVYSVLTPTGEDASLRRHVVATLWRARTVEADLGVRSGAAGVVAAARAEGLLDEPSDRDLRAAAAARVGDPSLLPSTSTEAADDARLAGLAVTVALRRHARPAVSHASRGRDLRRVGVVVGSGGVLRHADDVTREAVLSSATGDHVGRWRVPEAPRVVVDAGSVLFAAGLLAGDHPVAAARLALGLLDGQGG